MTRSGFLHRDDGAAAIEFGLIAIILVMLLVCATDLGLAFYSDMQVQAATEAGTQYAVLHGYSSTAIQTAASNATAGSGISSNSSEFCGCASSSGVSTAICSSTCSDGTMAGVYVTVTSGKTYQTLIHYPLLPAVFQQSATSTVRIQ